MMKFYIVEGVPGQLVCNPHVPTNQYLGMLPVPKEGNVPLAERYMPYVQAVKCAVEIEKAARGGSINILGGPIVAENHEAAMKAYNGAPAKPKLKGDS